MIIDILSNDFISEGVQASADNSEVMLLNPFTGLVSENPHLLEVSGEGSWSYDVSNGLLSFSPETGFVSDPTPVSYYLCKINLPESCSRANVTVTYQEIVPHPVISLVKSGSYSQ